MSQQPTNVPNSPSQLRGDFERRYSGPNTDDDAASILEFWRVLKRRRYHFAIPTIAIGLAIIVYAYTLPDFYRSEATILIEDPQVPRDVAGAATTNYVLQQVELISQRIFTVKRIKEVVEKFDVYGLRDKEGRIVPDSVLADWFRGNTTLDLGNTDSRRDDQSEFQAEVDDVVFTLAFSHRNPETALQVTEEIVVLMLNEKQRSSASSLTEISGLLVGAINDANEQLLAAEAVLAEFKSNNEGALPELYELNLKVIDRNEQQLRDVDLRIQNQRQRRLQLSSELAALNPYAPVRLPSGEIIMSDRERLRSLQIDFSRKSSIYEAGHPDLVRLEREIEMLRRTVGGAKSYLVIEEELRQERERLAALRGRYSDEHPDIRYSEAAIANLESQLAATSPGATVEVEAADNPAYVLMNTQLQMTDLELQSLGQLRVELQSNIAKYEALIRRAPQVEMQYNALIRVADNAETKYIELQDRLRAADVAGEVDQEIAGQRLVLIEPPVFPTDPEDQNRNAIVLLGLILSVGVGAGLTLLVELMDKSIRSERVLTNIVGSPPLAVIPYLNNSVDIANARGRRLMTVTALLATALSVVYVISYS